MTDLLGPNRVLEAEAEGKRALALMEDDALERLWRSSAIEDVERRTYLDWNVRARALELITLNESLTVFNALGQGMADVDEYGWPKDTGLAMRIAVEVLMGTVGPRVMA